MHSGKAFSLQIISLELPPLRSHVPNVPQTNSKNHLLPPLDETNQVDWPKRYNITWEVPISVSLK